MMATNPKPTLAGLPVIPEKLCIFAQSITSCNMLKHPLLKSKKIFRMLHPTVDWSWIFRMT
jgi:hypothetical protein